MISQLRKLIICSAVVFCGFVSVLPAQAELKIAVVDVQKALGSSDSGKKAQSQYKTEVQKAQADIDKQKVEFEKRQEAYEKQKATLSDSARSSRRDELAEMRRSLERKFQDSQESLQRKNVQLVGEISKTLKQVIQELGKEKGYSIILDRNDRGTGILFADDAIDITDEVVRRVNAAAK